MKELSIEEKAKRYDKAIREASIAYKDEDRHLKATLERIFPELKESEGEKIRKRIITLVKAHGQGMYKDEMIAWLEKQREQETIETSEHKYNIGDWIIAPELPPTSLTIAKVVYIFDDQYDLEYLDGTKEVIEINKVDNTYFRWTIEDAKEGDVLHSPSHHLIWIYKNSVQYHACVNTNYAQYYDFDTNGWLGIPKDVFPATKDEQTILFERIKRAGYEWNEDKKELIKL